MESTGVPSPVLMENAGRSAALVLSRIYPEGRVLVFAGPGNNGGDGLVLARTLAASGRDVDVIEVGVRGSRDALLHGWALERRVLPESDSELAAAVGRGGVVVDALLGTGARNAPRDPFPRAIRAINAAGAPTVALDLPSGVDADTGRVPGDAVMADLTVAFGAPKLGTLLYPARELAGRIVAVEIGLPPLDGTRARARLVTPGWAHDRRPRRPPVTHKKAEGRLLALAGSPGVAGAAVLAARGALRAGAGYVRVASHPDNREVVQRSAPEAIFVDVTDREALARAAADSDVLAAGPGMGTDDDAATRLSHMLTSGPFAAVLLDADALTLLGAGTLPALSSHMPCLLTPHAGEMARLGADLEEVRSDPLAACAREARRRGAAVLLKGRPSVVCDCAEGSPLWVSGSG
ncbi:MAG TPA: NAD(P)H-hydrate epimerase, partial [Candidatus Eisenbacteria bacterium]